jgi:hypothetical protein
MNLFCRISVTAIAIVTLGACSSVSGPGNDLQLKVSGATFQRVGAPAVAMVPFSLTNRGATSASVARCDSRVMAAVDRWDGGSWVQYSSDACLAVYITAPLELAPGATISAERSVLESGTYRLRIGTSKADGSDFDWSIVSGQFEVL